ncbi:NADH dehydrogenase [ubiquinone] 1 alpha subcomplex assembly factor 4-like [Patiria miniata]|uniref:NADH dehydrogenase [ubiquinone] 1 alpha subcomplex assembly factor 4 n=1 Tax=Patiria miniata TaxID=46514 RepID=A0A914BPY2_PATMI|nr:NADH dehydrogenase [ubiquinone] 1 alpha subcomplex assembly factor 4-like [Patiria miniata]XP_038078204.1 NADH dehydrogenase [ubiquinone] 1 alpha subcomplex assembly factor 4-like [Patiria miniata]XP_038078205.1 NADH dehydrogenase [ubiquinone] 1 alpha subcomplex assembly factor 4-like [Patiria miniata]
MGNALKMGVRTVQRFNAENRAHRLLDKDKIRSAPRHPTTAKEIQELQQKNPDVLEQQQKKDERLLGFLQNIRVDSMDPEQQKLQPEETTEPKPSVSKMHRTLPSNRKPLAEATTMFEVPDEVPEGRLTVPMAMEILAKHKRNPKEWPVERLATDYKLDLTDTQNILEYFQSFKVIPIESSPNPPPVRLMGR